ncbi:MAG: SIS domain-containing protein [Promethearchaeota archaeon]
MTTFVDELLDQPRALDGCWRHYRDNWEGTIGQFCESWASGRFDRVVVSGMGSSLFAGHTLFVGLNRAGVPTWEVDAGELLRTFPKKALEKTLLVLVSQSGESGEVVGILDGLEADGVHPFLVGVVNDEGSTLGQAADVVLPMKAGPETSVTSKTYTCTLLVHYLLVSAARDRSTSPERLEGDVTGVTRAVAEALDAREVAGRLAASFTPATKHIEYIAHGTALSTAYQAALNTKEIVKVSSEASSFGQFRHGGIEMTCPEFRAVVVANEPWGASNGENLALSVAERWGGGAVLFISNHPVKATGKFDANTNLYRFQHGVEDPFLSPIVEIVPVQLLLVEMARQRGVVPGEFRYSSKITRE